MIDLPGSVAPTKLAVGDVDGDGRPDLVTSNFQSRSVTLLLNHVGERGRPAFAVTTLPAGNGPSDVEIADLTGDGILDLAVANGLGEDADGATEIAVTCDLSDSTQPELTYVDLFGGSLPFVEVAYTRRAFDEPDDLESSGFSDHVFTWQLDAGSGWGWETQWTFSPGDRRFPRYSPDGRSLAYEGKSPRKIFLLSIR